MTPHQKSALLDLFDSIREKIKDGELEFSFVKDGLKRIDAGLEYGADTVLVPVPPADRLKLIGTFETQPSAAVETVEGADGDRIHLDMPRFGTRLRIGPFFTKQPSPATEGGTSAILEACPRLTIREIVAELAGPSTDDGNATEGRLIARGITFSFRQAIDVLSAKWPEPIAAFDRRTVMLLVHAGTRDDLGVAALTIWTSKEKMYGKDIDDNHVFTSSVIVLTRNIPGNAS